MSPPAGSPTAQPVLSGPRWSVDSPEHRAAVARLEAEFLPFDDVEWRTGLAALTTSSEAASRAFAADARTLAVLTAAVPRTSGDHRGGTVWTSFVREVAVARRCSDAAAAAEVAVAEALVTSHPITLALLDEGRMPVVRATVLVRACLAQPGAVVAAVETELAARACGLPPWRIKQEVTRIALRVDPEAAARQEAVATALRTARKDALPDGQAEIVLTGPAAQAQRWWDALTDRARALRAAGDPRSLGALRFDLATTTDPRSLDGLDPLVLLHSPQLQDLRAQANDPPGAASAPADPPADAGSSPPTSPAGSPGSAPGVGTPAAGGNALGPPLTDDARCSRPVQVVVQVPVTTALGLSDEPGWLDGHGWISAPQARQLLTLAELRKACVAAHSGQLVDLETRVHRPPLGPPAGTAGRDRSRARSARPAALRRTLLSMVITPTDVRDLVVREQSGYRPSAALEHFVQLRDRYCDGPTGAQVPARRTDTDHHDPWPHGPTAAHNLVPRSPRTHHLRHFGWRAVRSATGTRWTSPAGQVVDVPRHDRPPPRLPPGRRLPDPTDLRDRDAELTRAHDRDHRDDPDEPEDVPHAATSVERPGTRPSLPGRASDEDDPPPF